jgi:hypothetical protein
MTDSVKLCTRRESRDPLTMPAPIEVGSSLVIVMGLANRADQWRGGLLP